MNKSIAALMRKVGRANRLTNKMWVEYEELRQEYKLLSKSRSLKVIDTRSKISVAMQVIEMKIRELWRPHRKLIGVCTKCGETRALAMIGRKYGYGCIDGTCGYFEAVKTLTG